MSPAVETRSFDEAAADWRVVVVVVLTVAMAACGR
jgi:hypothetical protein